MNASRIGALLAVPAVLSLAACGGGGGTSSAGIANITGSTASVRFVNGNPTSGAVDVYIQSTGSAAPSAKVFGPLAYGEATDYMTEAAVAGNVITQTAGGQAPSTGAKPLASCPIPSFGSGKNYTIVFGAANTVAQNCLLFQDNDYTGSPQIRVHDASNDQYTAGNTALGFGTIAAPSAVAGTNFAVLADAGFGEAAIGIGTPTFYSQSPPVTITPPGASSISFAVGQNTTVGGTEPSIDTLDSRYIFTPGSFNQPNTSGSLNYPGSAGTSLFALDCTAGSIAALPHVQCNAGVALVGYTDSK